MKTKLKKGSIDLFIVAPGVWGMKDVFVNMYIIKDDPQDTKWWLIDGGIRWSGKKIKGMADILFGEGSRPEAIILTHGHFDHVGSIKKLAEEWDVPVYAHHLEIPYLTGISSYPPADPASGGGILADLSFLYPKGPINIGSRVVSLPPAGRIPGSSQWRYIHTPGHAAGHISLFRDSDKVLIAGDAITTTTSESIVSTVLQLKKLAGPPKYLTSDWLSAASSVEALAALEPEIIASGHGRPLRGDGMRKSLHNLALDFQKKSVPSKGRYTRQPALMDDSGVVHIPPKNINASTAPTLKFLGISAAVLITVILFSSSKKRRKKRRLTEYNTSNHTSQLPDHQAKKHFRSFKPEIDKFRHNFDKKAKAVSAKVSAEAERLKDPALALLDRLKFKR